MLLLLAAVAPAAAAAPPLLPPLPVASVDAMRMELPNGSSAGGTAPPLPLLLKLLLSAPSECTADVKLIVSPTEPERSPRCCTANASSGTACK